MKDKIKHRCCGSRLARHLSTCPQNKGGLKLENGTLVTVALCRNYYKRFASTTMNENHRRLFRFLLELAEQPT